MTEPRATYGPQARYNTTVTYQVVFRGQVESCEGRFSVEAPSALHAAAESLAMVKSATRPHRVTNLVLQVSLDL